MASTSSVARIAYICSDVLIDSQPIHADSEFSSTYTELLKESASRGSPRILITPHDADPAINILHYRSTNLLSFTALSSSSLLTRLVPYLHELSNLPLVLHIAVDGDLSDVLVLRSAIPFFIYSSTHAQAHDNALLASRLARTEQKAVVHVFERNVPEGDFAELPVDKITAFLVAEKAARSNGSVNGHTNGTKNGVNGHKENGTNGHANGNGQPSLFTPSPSPSPPPQTPSDDSELFSLYKAYESASLTTLALVRRPVHALSHRGSSHPQTVFVTLGRLPAIDIEDVSVLSLSLLSPLLPSKLLHYLPASVKRVVVLEAVQNWTVKWTPLYLDVIATLHSAGHRLAVHSVILGDSSTIFQSDIHKLLQQVISSPPKIRLSLGRSVATSSSVASAPVIPKIESTYFNLLAQTFSDKLEISNTPDLALTQGSVATSPEYALGRVRRTLEEREVLVRAVKQLVEENKSLSPDLLQLLSKWLLSQSNSTFDLANKIIAQLESLPKDTLVSQILNLKSHFPPVSRWIIGSDAWSYDAGFSGLHHLISSGLNINILVVDAVPYSLRNNSDPTRRKRDIGLYAMNHADVYVASVAVYSSYGQLLQALVEADRFDGPSVVLAHLPYNGDTSAVDVLKETKLAVDTGYWPLYRWDPSKEKDGKEPFSLDSDKIKNELQEFLDRQNHLSQLTRSKPQLAAELVGSLGEKIKEARKKKATQAFDDLLSSMSSLPVTILYASDGGNAERKAKRLENRAKARGLVTTLAIMDHTSIESVAEEEYVIFITSTAGQGEPPQNGRTFFKTVNALVARSEKPFTSTKFAVFGMGDSHYWPRPEDAHYYNKPSKDLFERLKQLGAEPFADLGLGDDQDADGQETGYKIWEHLVWKALGVDSIQVTEAEPDPITNEHMKIASNYLRGTITEGLEDKTTGAIAPSDQQLTKFHGIYMQDDRDIRDERLAQGVEPAYSFMIRVRTPGGVCTPQQWLAMDRIADEHGCGTFKITTRQTFQFHGVIKGHLKSTIQEINRTLLDTLAACGDVNRNVICSAIPTKSKLHAQVYSFGRSLSERLLPQTSAYHEIWLDKKLVAGDAVKDFEPLYGEFYLPRKFKVAVAVPPTNDVDVFANDVGFIAIVNPDGSLAGFNVTVGGGMGVTHGSKKTYPRLGSIIGFCTPEEGHEVAEKIMLTQRDNGNRVDRKNARLKYTVDRMGLDNFRAEVERRLGFKLQPAREYTFDRNIDDFGWSIGENGKHNFMMFIENGRVQDELKHNFKEGLREIAKIHNGTFRMTANQHLMLADIATEELPQIKDLLAKYKLDNLNFTGLRLSSSACVAFPTCGLAMAESERYLPVLIDKVEEILEENGLRNDSIVMRMTGCPNGCARPYVAEVAFVGKAPGTYLMLLGGGYYGQRLNKIYRESVTEPEILAIMRPMIKQYALDRRPEEKFGDFVIRTGYISATTSGKEWYEGMGGEGVHREISISA